MQRLHSHVQRADHAYLASSGSSVRAGDSLKLVELSQGALQASASAVNGWISARSSDVWLRALPRHHIGGFSIEVRAQQVGCSVYNLETWSPELFHSLLRDHRVTLTSLVPTQLHDLIRKNLRAPESLRWVMVGGAALSPELAQQALDLHWPIAATYGMTETASQIASARTEDPLRLHRLPHMSCDLVEGRLRVKSAALMSGYGQIVQGQIEWTEVSPNTGWITGDHAELSGDVVVPLGRGSDFARILGETVSLKKIEAKISSLLNFPFAVVARTDSRRGESLLLVVESGRADLQQVNSRLDSLEQISEIINVDKIPRSELGKPLLSRILSLSQSKLRSQSHNF